MCHDVRTGRTCSTSSIQREVSHAHGQSGSNQKSAVAVAAGGATGGEAGVVMAPPRMGPVGPGTLWF